MLLNGIMTHVAQRYITYTMVYYHIMLLRDIMWRVEQRLQAHHGTCFHTNRNDI